MAIRNGLGLTVVARGELPRSLTCGVLQVQHLQAVPLPTIREFFEDVAHEARLPRRTLAVADLQVRQVAGGCQG